MRYNAFIIKKWIIDAVTTTGWVFMISKALPELMHINPKFSAFYVGKSTLWEEKEVMIIRSYLKRLHDIDLPEEVIHMNVVPLEQID